MAQKHINPIQSREQVIRCGEHNFTELYNTIGGSVVNSIGGKDGTITLGTGLQIDANKEMSVDTSVIAQVSDLSNYVDKTTAQTISGAKTFTANDTYASSCGFSKANNLLSNSCYAAMRALSSNPFFGLRCNGTNYYLQATSSGLYLGPTSTVATSWASNGDITIRGTTQPKWNSKTLATTDQIPTAVSQLSNDSNYVSTSDIDQVYDGTSANAQSGIAIEGALSAITAVAQGKTASYVIQSQTDITGTKDANDEYTNVTAITGVTLADLQVGDIILIKDLNVPDYWVSQISPSVSLNKMETTKVDLTDYVTTNTAQTISATKTFSANQVLNNNIALRGNNSGGTAQDLIKMNNSNKVVVGNGGTDVIASVSGALVPSVDSAKDLGNSSYKWRYLYLSSGIKDASNTFSLPSVSGTLALTSDIPTNVSAFTNDSGYLTSSTGVTSVNGNVGAISNIAVTNANNNFSTNQQISGDSGDMPLILKSHTANKSYIHFKDKNGNSLGYFGIWKPAVYNLVYFYDTDDNTSKRMAFYDDIPSNLSDFNNDVGFITSADIPTIPAKDSDLVNDRYVRYDTNAQGLNATQKSNARTNIGAGIGSVTSVRVQATSPVKSSQNAQQLSTLDTTISLDTAYGDTQNPYGSKTANYVLAAPNGSAGVPSFRALVKADLPTLTASDVGALADTTTYVSSINGSSGAITGVAMTSDLSSYLPLAGGTMTGVINTPVNAPAINLRIGHGSYNGVISYRTSGNEAVCFDVQNSVTSFIFRTKDSSNSSATTWDEVTPSMQVKNQRVTINKLIANATDAAYNLDVGGTANATTIYENGTALSSKYQATLVSGTNIKTINGNSLLGSGDITISGGGSGVETATASSIAQRNSSGQLNAVAFRLCNVGTSTANATMQYNSNVGAVEFVF